MSTKTNYICYKLITNIKKGDLSGCFLPSKISDLAYSIETLVRSLYLGISNDGWVIEF